MVRSEERRLYSPAKMHWNSNQWAMRIYSHARARTLIIQSNIQSVFNEQSPLIWNRKLPQEFKAYWSFRMTSDVTCSETYKSIKTMHCSETWISFYLHRFLDFASTHILPKTCPALSWDQALLSISWVNRFQAGKANRKVSHIVQYLCNWITCACESNF